MSTGTRLEKTPQGRNLETSTGTSRLCRPELLRVNAASQAERALCD
jgi:hypothetical protein